MNQPTVILLYFTFSRYRNSVCSANRKLHLLAREIANLLRHFGGRRCDEAWRIRRKIMLTSSFGKIASLRSRDGAILYEEIGNSNLRIFLEKDEPFNERVTRAFCKSRREGGGVEKSFSLIKKRFRIPVFFNERLWKAIKDVK